MERIRKLLVRELESLKLTIFNPETAIHFSNFIIGLGKFPLADEEDKQKAGDKSQVN
jgi:hypothetical protein